ncbi:MAG: hypothetical protein FK734_01185 [Asgard group archaeon]|nr:hypothetical protein [Asgard group archaeon]
MADANKFDKILGHKIKQKNLSTHDSLKFILTSLKNHAGLLSCVLTDDNGLVCNEALHPRANRENLSAASAVANDAAHKISNYLSMGKITLNYLVSNNTKFWILPIEIPNSSDRFILLTTKRNSVFEKSSNNTLKLLGKSRPNVPLLMNIAAKWITYVFKH